MTREMKRSMASLMAFGMLVSSADARGQDTLRVAGPSACEECRIEVTRLSRLGALQDSTGPANYVWVAENSSGSFYVSPAIGYDGFLRYSQDGRLAEKLGRRGEGPGEFSVAGAIAVGAGDTIYVFDRMSRRLIVLAANGAFVRETRVWVQVDGIAWVAGGAMVVAGASSDPEMIGLPAHLINPMGIVVRSFGARDPVVDPRQTYGDVRSVGPGDDTHVWLAHLNRYQIERWRTTGEEDLVLVRDVGWFQAWASDALLGNPAYDRPRPTLRQVWQDEEGVLWAVSQVAASDWTARGKRPTGNPPMPSPDELPLYYDAIIEAIDPEAGRVLATLRVPHVFFQRRGGGGGGLVVGRSGDQTGLVYVDVWNVTLERREGGGD